MLESKKSELRADLLRRREGLAASYVRRCSKRIVNKLKELEEFERAQTVHCYVSWRNEVDTRLLIRDMLASGKRVVVPVVDLTLRRLRHSEIKSFGELSPGAFGILEPPAEKLRHVAPEEIDLVLVPGVAFDRQGRRIGFGGGYYDGFLHLVDCPKIGLLYLFQLVDHLPEHPADERVDVLVTEEMVIRIT